MNSDTLLQIVNGKYLNKCKNTKIDNIVIDSRKVNKGDTFIALEGPNNDGHNYLNEVLKKNPNCLIVNRNIKLKTKIPIILVNNTYESLIKIGTFFRNKYNIPLIGITGSIGKTTTKELISTVLSKKYKVLKTNKNFNNHIGVPLTLMNLDSSYDICVLEMGMNHLNEISKLSKISKPDIAVITNIGTSHIGNLGSKKNILKAKMEILDGMKKGILLINDKDKYLNKINYENKIKIYKSLKPYNIKTKERTHFKLKISKKIYSFSYNSTNKNLIPNFLFAIQIGLLFKINIEDIKDAIENYKMPKKRMNIYYHNTTKIIDDCYNASLESVIASLNVLKKEKGKKVLILGDILELGKYSKKIHKKIGKKIKTIKNIKVYLVGSAVKNIKGKNYKYFDNNNDLIEELKQLNKNNTIILIKGSRKMKLEEIVDNITTNNVY